MGANETRGSDAARQPVIFVPHGGGPCFWMEFSAAVRAARLGQVTRIPGGRRREPAGAAEGVRRQHRTLGDGRAHRQRRGRPRHGL